MESLHKDMDLVHPQFMLISNLEVVIMEEAIMVAVIMGEAITEDLMHMEAIMVVDMDMEAITGEDMEEAMDFLAEVITEDCKYE